MISIYTNMKYIFSSFIQDLISIDEFNPSTEVFLIDYDLARKHNAFDLKKDHKLILVVLDEEYNHNRAQEVYAMGVDYYIVVKSGEDINRFVYMLKSNNKALKQVEIDEVSNTITINGQKIKLTSKEMLIYQYFREHKGEVCSRKDILVNVLNYHVDTDTRLIDVYVKYLRTKLGPDGSRIKTIRGKGYIYE